MRNIVAFVVGGLFGAGLLLSGMTNTQKVQGWLDVFGGWDPTLAFVMGGAIIPMAIAWQLTKGRRPVLGGEFDAAPDPVVDRDCIVNLWRHRWRRLYDRHDCGHDRGAKAARHTGIVAQTALG